MKNLDSSQIPYHSDRLMRAAPNRYKMVVRVANRAKRNDFEGIDRSRIVQLKPVCGAIIKMTEEMNPPIAIESEVPTQKRINVSVNSAKTSFKKLANPQTWDTMVRWIDSSICQINPEAISYYGCKLIDLYPSRTCHELAEIIFLQKSARIAGVDFRKETPKLKQIIAGVSGWKLPEVVHSCVETILEIACIYGIEETLEKQKLRVIDIFALAFLNKRAIDTDIAWLKDTEESLKILSGKESALFKALMICCTADSASVFFKHRSLAAANHQLLSKTGHFLLNRDLSEAVDFKLRKARKLTTSH